MKTIYFILFSLFLCLSTATYSQEIPTRGEIYNFEVDDIFHTYNTFFTMQIHRWSYKNIRILSKYFSSNQDTVFYGRFVIGEDNYYDDINQTSIHDYYERYDTVFVSQLNNLVPADTVIEDESLYNGRTTTSYYDDTQTDTYITTKYTVGCGEVYYNYEYHNYPSPYERRRLLYFKKGLEEWGEPHLVINTQEINITYKLKTYPNPATTHITFELPTYTNETPQSRHLRITNISGKTVAELPLIKGQTQLVWNCSTVTSGVYFYQTEIDGVVYRGKIIVN